MFTSRANIRGRLAAGFADRAIARVLHAVQVLPPALLRLAIAGRAALAFGRHSPRHHASAGPDVASRFCFSRSRFAA